MVWITPEGPGPADLSRCVACGLCLPVCPTYHLTQEETASPRGRLSAMVAAAGGTIPIDEALEDVIGFCTQCRACEVVCPALVPFGKMVEGVRAEITVQRPSITRRLRSAVFGRWVSAPGLIKVGVRAASVAHRAGLGRPTLVAGLRDEAAVALRGRNFEPVGAERGTAALLVGCVMESGFSSVHVATIEVLRRAGYRVTIPQNQTCCGALAAHEGAAIDAHRLARRNSGAFSGVDLIVADAAGCSAHLKEYGRWAGRDGTDIAARARDVTEVVAEAVESGSLPVSTVDRGPVTVQDPCHLRHAQRIQQAPRTILEAAGYRVVEVDDRGMCCGAAGAWGILNPEASRQLGAEKAARVRAAGSSVVASANVGCEMQLRSHLDPWYRIAHPVELYWSALVEDGR
jgi:glycolate oxidase iron-sulfur subunit